MIVMVATLKIGLFNETLIIFVFKFEDRSLV